MVVRHNDEPFSGYTPMPEPSSLMLQSSAFAAIWDCIKTWDINVPSAYAGYCGATGSHVALILQALHDAGILSLAPAPDADYPGETSPC
jgi:hypothetical protein